MSDSFPLSNGDRTPEPSRQNGAGNGGVQGKDIALRVDQLKADLERLQAILGPEDSNASTPPVTNAGNTSPNDAVPVVARPIQEMHPPESVQGSTRTNQDLVTMKVKVPRASVNGGAHGNGVPHNDDLVTMRVKVPRASAPSAPVRPGSDPDLMTMKVKVPRSSSLDPTNMGHAIAQSLDALNEATPDVAKQRSNGTTATPGVPETQVRSETFESHASDEEEFVPDEAPQIGRELSMRDVFFMVRERWMIGIAVGLLFAGFYSYWKLNEPPVYRSFTEVQIKLKAANVLPIEGMEESVGTGSIDSAMEVHRKTLLSRSYEEYLLTEHLNNPDGSASELKQTYMDGLVQHAKLEQRQQLDAALPERLFQEHFNRARHLEVNRRKAHPFLEVAYSHPVPEVAQGMANLVTNAYDRFLLENRKQDFEAGKKYVQAEVVALKQKIKDAERDIQLHRQEHNLFESENGGSSRASNVADSLQTRIQDTEVGIVKIKSQLELIKLYDRSDVEQLSQQSFIAEFGPVATVQEQLIQNRQEFAQLDLKYGARWPAVIANRTAHENLLAQLARNVELAIQATENSLKKLTDEQARLRDNQKSAEALSLGVNDPAVLLKEMQSLLELDKKSFEMMQNRHNEMEISEKLDRTNVEVMQEATRPRFPVVPDRNRIMQITALIFFGTFIGLPVGLGFLDNRLKSFSEAEAFLGKECLGVIPERRRFKTVDLGQSVLGDLDDEIVESFRVILGSIDLSSRVPCPKVIVTTSAGPGEGKSFVTANLAAMLARHGKRCLIVDCDLRKPSQHKLVDVKNDFGLMSWLRAGAIVPPTAEAALSDASLGILPLGTEGNLFLLRAGGTTRSPSELITSRNFEALLGVLRNLFDIILVDSPPVGLFPDALFLAGYAEESLFVCKHNGLNRHKIKFGLRKMERCHCEVLGVIMNQLSASRRHQYGYGYRDYGYGYYGSKEYANYYTAEDDEPTTRQG